MYIVSECFGDDGFYCRLVFKLIFSRTDERRPKITVTNKYEVEIISESK